MFDCLDTAANQTSFGALVGISQQAVAKLMERGTIPRAGTHRELLLAYVGSLRERAAGRSGEAQESLTNARIRESTANAVAKELANAKEARQLVDAAAIEPLLRSWAALGHSAVQAAGERIVEAIESRHGIQLEEEDVMGHLRTALRDIANYPSTLAGEEDQTDVSRETPRSGTSGQL